MRLAFIILLVATVAGCGKPDPATLKVDGTSEATFEASIEAMRESMTPDERKEFERNVTAVSHAGGLIASTPGGRGRQSRDNLHGKTIAEIRAEAQTIRDKTMKRLMRE